MQSRWMETLKTKINTSESCEDFTVEPPLKISGPNTLESHYLKPVIIVAPDVQIGNYILEPAVCPGCKIVGKLKSNGWVDSYRYVHGVKTGIIILILQSIFFLKCMN